LVHLTESLKCGAARILVFGEQYEDRSLPDVIEKPIQYEGYRGCAPHGISPTNLNKNGQQIPPDQEELDRETILPNYKKYYGSSSLILIVYVVKFSS
jgi:hypothetical protein